MGDMSGEYAGHGELCTDPCNIGPCIIMLQNEVMVVDEWHNNGPQDHLCSLSICYGQFFGYAISWLCKPIVAAGGWS